LGEIRKTIRVREASASAIGQIQKADDLFSPPDPSHEITIPISLRPAAGVLPQLAIAPNETRTHFCSKVLAARQIKNLPINARDAIALLH